MTQKTKVVAALSSAALVGLVAAGLTVAGQRIMERGDRVFGGTGPGGRFLRVLSSLDLTDEQKAKIKSTLTDEQPKIEPLVETAIQSKRALFEAIHATELDENAVRTAAAAAAGAQTDLALERARMVSTIRGFLNAEQQGRLDAVRQDLLDHLDKRASHMRAMWRDADLIDAL